MAIARPAPWRMFYFITALLIVPFIWRVCVPASEYGSRGVVYLDMLINVGLLVGLYGTRKQLVAQAPDDERWRLGNTLYWVGMIAGIGMLLIRFTSDSGWWTGHLMYH